MKFYKFYFFLFFTLYLVYSFLEILFLLKLFYCISLSLSALPFPALFVTTDRQNHLIGPKIRVALLEDNGLEMQA
jgi:hypothetical protein